MISQVRIKNFRGIGDETIELDRLSVLVGRNGAGKSSVVDALRFIRDAVTVGLDDAFVHRHGIVSLRRWSPTRPYDIGIEIRVNEVAFSADYQFTLVSLPDGGFKVKHESCVTRRGTRTFAFDRDGDKLRVSGNRGQPTRQLDKSTLALPGLAIFSPDLARLRGFLRTLGFFAIFPNTLREPQKPSAQKILTEHGENLATVVRALKAQNPDAIDAIITALDNVVGGIRDIRVQQVGGFLATELKHAMSAKHTAWFDLSQESDGTLRMLGLLVALYQGQRRFLAIEEPELTLHPGALSVLSDVLGEVANHGQLLITTQSPDLIARFPADQLRVVDRQDGVTCIGRLAEDQRQSINDQLFSAGDLLRIEGLRRETALGRVEEPAEAG
jgi:predicted ATPase